MRRGDKDVEVIEPAVNLPLGKGAVQAGVSSTQSLANEFGMFQAKSKVAIDADAAKRMTNLQVNQKRKTADAPRATDGLKKLTEELDAMEVSGPAPEVAEDGFLWQWVRTMFKATAAALAEGTAVSPSRDGAMMMKMHVPSLQKKRPPTFLNL